MEYYLFQESSKWRDSKNRRVIAFVRIGAYTLIASGLIWIPISLIEHLYLLFWINLFSEGLAIYSLVLLKQNRIMPAKILLFLIATCYILFICIFYSGFGIINGGTGHFWFIVLAISSYFLLYDLKPIIRDSIPLLLLLIFLLYHFGYAPVHLLKSMSRETARLNDKISAISAMLAFFFITRQFVLEITKAENELAVSADRLEGIMDNMLPKTITERLRKEGKTFADEYHDCSVLFADIVGFTAWSEIHSPNEVVDRLNNIFSKFDEIVEEMKLTKIKTMGDSYMVASGIPEGRSNHAVELTELAIRLHKAASGYDDINFRIGINSGSVVAGVIGKKVFIYDLWGDTVNIASRMESSGEAGKVNISGSTYELVKDKFNCTHRGKIQAKNKGEVDMYFVEIKK